MSKSTDSHKPGSQIEADHLQTDQEAHQFVFDIQEDLAHYILQGKGIQDILDKMTLATGCSTALEDYTLTTLAASFPENDSYPTHLLKPSLSVRTNPAVKNNPGLLKNLNKPLILTEQHHDMTVNRLIVPVRAGSELLGYFSLLKPGTPFTDHEVKTAYCTVNNIAVLLAHEKKVGEIELRLKGHLVEDLISGNYLDTNSIQNRARALEYDITVVNRVLVAHIKKSAQSSHHDEKSAGYKNELIKKIQSIASLTAKSLVVHRNNEMIILIQESSTEHSYDTIKNLCEEIIREVTPLIKAELYIGIGSSCTELADYKKAYIAARKALEIGEYMITEGHVRSFEQFKTHALFLSTLKPEELYTYAKNQLGSLLLYDEKHQSELIKTLQEFLYLRNNIEGTAKSLKMSVSGIKYRLKKIEKIIGFDLKDYKICFDLQLALIILQLFGEYRIRNSA